MTTFSPLVLGLDCSTTACKAVVWDCHGNALAKGFFALELLGPQPGWHEQRAELWWTATVQAIRQAVCQVDAARIKALCITHQRETFVPVDEQGRPLCNAILWMDERARDLLPNLEHALHATDFHRITGKHLSVNLTIAKIAWLCKYQPNIFNHATRFVDVHSFLVHKLTGIYAAGWGCADPTGLFDMQNHCWAETVLDKIGILSAQLPELYAPGSIIANILPAVAETCGLPKGLPIAAGCGDGQAGGLGVHITRPGDAYLSLGTSVISGTFSKEYVFDASFRTMTGGIPGTYLLETVLLGGGYTIAWFMEKIAGQPGQRGEELYILYEQAASSIPPGSEGLVAVPYWNSVLGPYWDAAASGIVIGWRGIHQRAHLYRAILEGIAFEQHICTLGVEQTLHQPVDRFIAMGGGAQNHLWLQIIADITNKPVFRSVTTDSAALGAGIMATVAAGGYADARQAAQAMTQVLPEPIQPHQARHEFYSRLFQEVYRPLFPACRPYLDRLASLSTYPDNRI
jgi:sugar (pentulose or hexulose) kinase